MWQTLDQPAIGFTQLVDLDVENFDVSVRVTSIELAFAVRPFRELGIVERWPIAMADCMTSRQRDLDAHDHGGILLLLPYLSPKFSGR